MTTLQDVANLAGVSTATVSRALNTPELVDPSTRSRVTSAINTSGYSRNETARSLALRSSRTIGLLTETFNSNYFTAILDAAVNLLHQHGYFTIVEAIGNQPHQKNPNSHTNACRELINRQAESIIVVGGFMEDKETAQMLFDHPNTVIIGRDIDGAKNRCITLDNYEGGRLAAKHLIEKGHREIAMITGPAHKVESQQRSQGFKDELMDNGICLSPSCIFLGDYSIPSGATAMRKIIKSKQVVSAIFAQNDDMAVGVLNECYKSKIQVPDDISIVGFDNSVLADIVPPTLTSINQPLTLMSTAAATMALNLCNNRLRDKKLPIPTTHFLPELVERNSVANINNYSASI